MEGEDKQQRGGIKEVRGKSNQNTLYLFTKMSENSFEQ